MPQYSTLLAGEFPPNTQRRESLVACAVAFASTFVGVLAAGAILGRTVPDRFFTAPIATTARPATALRAAAQPLGRREALAGMAAAVAAVLPADQARAAYGSSASAGGAVEEDKPPVYERFYGAANPPATYGGLGGTTPELARYSYETNVATWKEITVGKVDKGVGGVDSRWAGPGKRSAFCVTVVRAGEDGKSFTEGRDPEQVIKSLSGAEPNLQEAIANGEVTYAKTEVNGVNFLDFDVSGAPYHYIVRVGFSDGRLFAFFVSAPEKSFAADEANLRRTLSSFEVYSANKFTK